MTRKTVSMIKSAEQRRKSSKNWPAQRLTQQHVLVVKRTVRVERPKGICMRSHPTDSINTQANEKTPQADDVADASAAVSEPSHTADQTAVDGAKATIDQDEQASQPKDATEAAEPLPSHANGDDTSGDSIAEATQENATTTQDDHDDHIDVVEGEEDTVIY
jgi:hypothetical protein